MGRIHKYLNKLHVYQSRQVVRGKRQAWPRRAATQLSAWTKELPLQERSLQCHISHDYARLLHYRIVVMGSSFNLLVRKVY